MVRTIDGIIQLRRRTAIIAGEAAIVAADACAERGSKGQLSCSPALVPLLAFVTKRESNRSG